MAMPKKSLSGAIQIMTIQKIIQALRRNVVVFLCMVVSILVLHTLASTIMFLKSKLVLKLVEVKVAMEVMGVLEVQLEVSR